MGATRPASGIKAKAYTPNKDSQTALITRLSVNFFIKNPDAGRVAPISACVWCLSFLQRVSGNLKHPKNGLIFDANFEHPTHRIFTTQQ